MDEKYMDIAIKEAYKAYNKGEIPVGVVIVSHETLVVKAHNQKHTSKNAINHAEILAISKACKKLNSWRLNDCTMYVTLKPCQMCYGAIVESRIARVVYIMESNYDKLFLNNSNNIKMVKITNSDYEENLKKFFKEIRVSNYFPGNN